MSKVKVKPFSRLSAAAKRVAIAEDVLKQIHAKTYNIETGHWLSIEEPESLDFENMSSEEIRALFNKQIGPSATQNLLTGGKATIVLETPPANCTCCAVGAACASTLRLFNSHELVNNDLNGLDEGKEILEKYFTRAQVDLMEAAFEQRMDIDYSFHCDATERQLEAAVRFGQKYDDEIARAKAIFSNIVKNNGVFKPA